MIKPTGLMHAALFCEDVEESADFYTRVCGFERLFTEHHEDGSLFYIYLHAGNRTFIELFPLEGHTGEQTDGAGVAHLCIGVEDINAAAEHVESEGWPLESGPRKGADGNRQAWLVDPDGIRIELMQMMPDCKQYRALDERQ